MSSDNFVTTENAKIYKLELCNDKGQIVTNEIYQWDSAQDSDMDFKIGAKVQKPVEGAQLRSDTGQTEEVQNPKTVHLSIISNCKRITITKGSPASGYDNSLLDVDNENKTITFKEAGKCMVTIIGEHANGTTDTVTWKFNTLSEDYTPDQDNTPGDTPKYEDRDTIQIVTPSSLLQKLGDTVTFDVITNATTTGSYQFSANEGNTDKIIVDAKTNTVKAIKAGTFKVMSSMQFRQAKAQTYEVNYTVVGDGVFTPEEDAIVIQLYNKETQRTTKLVTSNNKSEEDVTYILPEASGTLLTENDLKKNLSLIERPVIISPVTGTTEYTGDILSSPFSLLMGYKDEHVMTTWEVSDTKSFDRIYLTKKERYKPNLTRFNHGLMGGVKIWVRVKYHSTKYDSFWSEPVEVTYGGHGYDSLKNPVKKVNENNPLDGTYYGIVPHSELVDDYDYRGTYNTILNACTYYTAEEANGSDKIEGAVKTGKDYGQNMKVGYQVLHPKEGDTKVSLWRCKKAMTPDLFRRNPPKANSEYWELDERDNLCTPYHLVDRVGVGIIDPFKRTPADWWNRNADGYSTGPCMIRKLVNHTDGWLKFGYNGKILYTTKKPISMQIAWTDLAKRDVVYGNRTLRIGRRLYWVRLLTKEEYTMLMNNLTNGKLANMSESDLSLSSKTWIEDFQESPIRIRMTGKGQEVVSDPKYRDGVWRPVLELIPEGSEPYRNLPNCPVATDEVFQYDPYSDTGYFGVVPYDKIMKADELITAVGHSGGSNQYLDAGYLKFYWHGRILYINKKTIKNNVIWQMGLDSHSVHGVDMGGAGKKSITITCNGEDITMPVSFPIQSRLEPWSQDLFDGRTIPKPDDGSKVQNQGELQKHTLDAEVGKYSMWSELFYRVGLGYFGFTEVDNDGKQWVNGYMELHGGYQLGDNWTEFPTTELQVKYDSDGNGTLQWGRDIGTEKRHSFNPDSSTIEWPTEPEGEGTVSEDQLNQWCREVGMGDVDWFKKKYPNWATKAITKQFIQNVTNKYNEMSEVEEHQSAPTSNRVNNCGYRGMAYWDGDHDFSFADAGCGLRLVCSVAAERLKIRR